MALASTDLYVECGANWLIYTLYVKKQDYKKAFEWWRAAAGLGLPEAQYSVGWCYYEGKGVKQDYDEALKWYRLAAEQGNSDAIAALSELGEEI